MDDARHLERLTWAVYDGTLLVGVRPKLPGDCPWCTVLACLHKHIYWGCNDVTHCPPHTLGSWDCQEWIEVLQTGGRLSSARGRWRRASQPRRRSRSSSRCHSQTLAQGNRDGHSCSSFPHMPLRCYCGASAVNVLSHAQSSHSSGEMAWASLDDDNAWDDDFQTPHTLVCCVLWREDDSHGEPVDGRMESLRGSPGWRTGYQVDIG